MRMPGRQDGVADLHGGDATLLRDADELGAAACVRSFSSGGGIVEGGPFSATTQEKSDNSGRISFNSGNGGQCKDELPAGLHTRSRAASVFSSTRPCRAMVPS